jgi:hypothetical protein
VFFSLATILSLVSAVNIAGLNFFDFVVFPVTLAVTLTARV